MTDTQSTVTTVTIGGREANLKNPVWRLKIDQALSDDELAEQLGVSRPTVAKMLAGEVPALDVLLRVADRLGVSPVQLASDIGGA